MTQHNHELATIFHAIALMYRFMGGDNSFRARAYQKASQVVRGLPEDISTYVKEDTLDDIPGIGASLAKDIREFDRRGVVNRFEKLKKKVPHQLIPLMDIAGFGPQSLKKLHQKLRLTTPQEVTQALQDGSVAELKGFGAKKVENMLRGLKLHKQVEERMLLWDAQQVAQRVVDDLKTCPGVLEVSVAGSLRRSRETIGDLDILAAVRDRDRASVGQFFTSSSLARRVLARGDTRASIILKDNGRQADLRMVDQRDWGAALQYFTGSREHNIHLRTIARDLGYKINEYGIFDVKRNRRVAGKTEADVYAALGMQSIPPEMREDRGEIELALKQQIPRLVELNDIRGDLQMHSTWSDGLMSLSELVAFVRKNFRYDYVAITDHSKSERVAGGMDEEAFARQIDSIRKINHEIGHDFLKAGAEVDILADGSLDLSDELLSRLDWVTASIHSGLGRDNTGRLIRACENPWVHCIGHPTGRIIGKRAPDPLDFGALAAAAAATGTALEINAQPDRMDMNDELAAEARKKGAMIVISTDSHKYADFYGMQLGVAMARRAWCTADNILNTRPWKDIRKFTAEKRRRQALVAHD